MSTLRLAVVGARGMPGIPGGVEHHCEELYPRLAAAGVEVTVFARKPYVLEPLNWRGVRVEPLPAPTGKSTEALIHTIRAFFAARSMSPDVLHCHSIGPGGVLPLGRILGLRSVLTVHAFDYLQTKWGKVGSAYLRYGEWAGVRTADAVICVAQWMTDELEARTPARVTYIPNGPLTVKVEESDALVRSLGLEPGRYALFVGRLVPDKRVEDLVEASRRLSVPVVIAGDTSYTDGYVRQLTATAGSDAVFTGFREGAELQELYSHAAAFVLPSSVEGLPLSLLEAMSLGLPCVASDIPGNREVLGDNGWLYPVGDTEALGSALVQAMSLDAAGLARVSAAEKARVGLRYDWDSIAEQTLNVLARVAR